MAGAGTVHAHGADVVTSDQVGAVTGNQVAVRYFRPDKFQIVSAGKDLTFGGGGQFNELDAQLSQFRQQDTPALAPLLQFDADNLTNFAEGRLVRK